MDAVACETITGTRIPVWNAARFERCDMATLLSVLSQRKQEISTLIDVEGGLLFRGFEGLFGAEDFQDVLRSIAPNLMEYVGGTSPRSTVYGRIMTSTEVPQDYSIPLHQEMSYTDGGPDRIAFFCQTPAERGGETTIGDMRLITKRIDRGVIERFRKKGGLQLYRNLPSREALADRPGVPKSWQETFGVETPNEVDFVVKERGWRGKWQADGSLSLWQEKRPATRVNLPTGDEVWCNQVHIFHPTAARRWALEDGRLAAAARIAEQLAAAPYRVDTVLYGDGDPIPESDVMHVYEALATEEVPLIWQRGDVLILDNTLTSHGRRPFSGERRILTALIGGHSSTGQAKEATQ